MEVEGFQDYVLEVHAIDVSIAMCGRARSRAMGGIDSALVDHYAMVRNYCEEVVLKNPGARVDITVDRVMPNEPPTLKSMWISFPGLIQGFLEGYRPIIGLDGCFLKGYVKGELLTAVGRDANEQMFPFAWAVVTVENKENWMWFLNHLMEVLNISEGAGWTFVSDKQKGLVHAIAEMMPQAEHRMYARHVYSNMRKSCMGAELKVLFWSAAKVGTRQEFEHHMADLKVLSKGAYDYLMKIDPKHWSRAFFSKQACCDAVENYMCETFNGKIVEARSMLVIWMFESIEKYVIGRMERNRIVIDKLLERDKKFTPRIKKKFDINRMDQIFWRVTYNGNNKFEVSLGEEQFSVNLNEGS